MPNLILTGIPRGGTTLAAAIIDAAPDAMCLSEPVSHADLMHQSVNPADYVRGLVVEFANLRRRILSGDSIVDRRDVEGRLLTNSFGIAVNGQRPLIDQWNEVRRPSLPADFLLGVKHNALYTAVLSELVAAKAFRVVSIVRDPIAAVLSWRSVNYPITYGRMPAGERFWPPLAELGLSDMDLTEKHLRLHDLMCARFASLSNEIVVLRYEDMISAPALLWRAAGIEGEPPSGIVRTATPQEPDRDLLARLEKLISAGELAGTARYYPQYAP